MAIDRILVLKLVGLAVGCGAKFVTGSQYVFTVYQGRIKTTFNYTQTQVELMSSMLNIGMGIGFLPGMFYDRFGPQWSSAVGLVVSVAGYLLIWSATRLAHFYHHNVWLMAIYFFLCGIGSAFTYIVALNTNMMNFPEHTGKIVGLLNAFFAGSPSIFSVIYYHIFGGSDFASFMLMFAILFGVMDVVCILCLKQYGNNPYGNLDTVIVNEDADGLQADNIVQIDSSSERSQLIANDSHENGPMELIDILKNADYQLFVWHIAFASCIGLIFANNITVISDAVGLKSYDDRITIVLPITNAILSATVGYLSDRFVHKIPRTWILMFGCVCFLLSEVLVLLFAYELSLLVIAAILAGFGVSFLWTMGPVIMEEMFYVGNMGRNWGIAILLATGLGFGAQVAFGVLYDAETTGSSETCTKGMACFRGGTLVAIAIAGVSIAIGLIMMLRSRCCTQNTSS